jgi:hypothetical protein
MNSLRFKLSLILLLTYAIVSPGIVHAQEAETDKGWNFKIGPDFYAPFVNGDVTMDSVGSGTLTSSLNYGGMLGFEAYSAKWAIGTNLLLVSSSSDITLPLTSRPASFDGKFTLIGLYGLRQAAKWLDLGLGGRVVLVDADLFIDGAHIKDSKYPTFAPLIAYKFNILDSKKWGITLQGDVGGFGINSTWTYLVNPYVGYRISKLFEIYAGYRLLSFSTVSDSEETEMDILMHGPKIGFNIHF